MNEVLKGLDGVIIRGERSVVTKYVDDQAVTAGNEDLKRWVE